MKGAAVWIAALWAAAAVVLAGASWYGTAQNHDRLVVQVDQLRAQQSSQQRQIDELQAEMNARPPAPATSNLGVCVEAGMLSNGVPFVSSVTGSALDDGTRECQSGTFVGVTPYTG